MNNSLCCAVIGASVMRFPWGFDEEAAGCQELKLELAQKIMELCQQGVKCFAVVADCGVGLYAGEIVNALRRADADLTLFVVAPYEEQATKWAPYLRERYFMLLENCTSMELARVHRTPDCEFDAYRRIIDCADMVLAVGDLHSAKGDAADRGIAYAKTKHLAIMLIPPVSGR